MLHMSNEPTDHAKCSWARILPRWFRRHFLQKKEINIQPSEANIEPNWAVEWIESISIFNRLRILQENLPGLLELCQEGERLCAAAVVSQVPERTWVKFTATLHSILKVLDNGVVINVLGLNDIPTSLRAKKRFQKQFARARMLLQEVSTTVPQAFKGLSDALIAVARSSVKYLRNQLAKTTKKIQKTKSAIDLLTRKQNEDTNALNEIEQRIKDLECDWADAVASLPDPLRVQINANDFTIGKESLALLNTIRMSYLAATEDKLLEHRLWEPIQSRRIRLLEHPTDIDKNSLMPLYLKRCNVVGATCSYSGKYREFLSRKECTQFDIVIIDEVSKATPPELLISALLGKKLILAGDFRQLPPTFKEGPH